MKADGLHDGAARSIPRRGGRGRTVIAAVAACIVLLVAMASMRDSGRSQADPATLLPEEVSSTGGVPVVVDVAVRPLYGGNEPSWVLVMGVTAADPADFVFPNGRTYDFVVRQHGREVWRWSAGRAFHQAIVERTFHPGEIAFAVEVWDGRDAGGNPLEGEVEVIAELTAERPVTSRPIRLELP